MDLSKSMEDDKEKLSALGYDTCLLISYYIFYQKILLYILSRPIVYNKYINYRTLLAETMQNITSNFRLGFGSFVDKVVMPYVSTVPRK